MKTLLAGTDSMEFGWMLMCWIPYLRYIAWHGDYGRVVIVCRAGNECLYLDFAREFVNYQVDGEADMWRTDGKAIGIPQEIKDRYPGAEIIEPSAGIRHAKNKLYWFYE
jgi:hypothetical protein